MCKKNIAIITLSLLASACSSVPTDSKQYAEVEEKEYVTGSNIPRKDRSSSTVKVYDKELLRELQDRPTISPNSK
jgi:starvation-inducible outer membrane lipoprotein